MDEGTVNISDIKISDIKIDPRRFQFRLGNVAEDGTRGILADVKVYNPIFADAVLVWQDKNRQLFFVDGHERLALAKRMGVQQVRAFILKEPEGISAEGAREEGIWGNIANGLYSVSELAVLFKNYDITLHRLSGKIFKAN